MLPGHNWLNLGALVAFAALTTWWALLGLAMLVFLLPATREVLAGATGFRLITVLKQTGFAELACAVGLFAGIAIGG